VGWRASNSEAIICRVGPADGAACWRRGAYHIRGLAAINSRIDASIAVLGTVSPLSHMTPDVRQLADRQQPVSLGINSRIVGVEVHCWSSMLTMTQRAPERAVKPSAGYSGKSPLPICRLITPAAMPISPMRVRSLSMTSAISRGVKRYRPKAEGAQGHATGQRRAIPAGVGGGRPR
jgi:hypothetical protein